jgi:hypothetical protein
MQPGSVRVRLMARLTCPSGYLVAGGGPNSGYASFAQMSDAPISSTTWEGDVYNTGAGAISLQLQFVCLAAPGLQAVAGVCRSDRRCP